MLTIRLPEVPMVKFRADLPAWMGAGLFIEIDSRPSGRVNQAFMTAREAVNLARRVRAAGVDAATDPGEKVRAQDDAGREFGKDWCGCVYDTCIIEWRTNLVDAETGRVLTCDRATFIELFDVKIAEISEAFIKFLKEIEKAGDDVAADTEATIKN